jgi:hypothetical protein
MTSFRLHASSIALGSEMPFFRITLAAFSASSARVAPGAWIPLVFVVPLVIPCQSVKLITCIQEIRDMDHKLFERGRGNVCSVEASTTV